MKTKTIKVFEYNELDEETQNKAYEKWLSHADFGWNSEYRESLEQFTNNFYCIRLVNWSVSEDDYNFRLHDTEESYSKTYRESDKKILLEIANSKEYIPTGFCADLLFHDSIKKEKENIQKMNREELIEFFREIYRDFFHGWSRDISHSLSKEYFEENYAHEYEYLENGEIA